jgi:hypothetical protein
MFQAAQQQSEGAEVMEPGGVETLAGRRREIWKDVECGAGRFGRWRVEAECGRRLDGIWGGKYI